MGKVAMVLFRDRETVPQRETFSEPSSLLQGKDVLVLPALPAGKGQRCCGELAERGSW